jgi:hypothetical protein
MGLLTTAGLLADCAAVTTFCLSFLRGGICTGFFINFVCNDIEKKRNIK